MARLRCGITMSLDGYVAGPRQSIEHPLGEGGEQLHTWAYAVRTFRAAHGMEGGETGPDDAVARESLQNIGATVMGQHMFGGGDGPWGDNPWKGWWGENPPFHTPVFVLTHHPREPLEMLGGTYSISSPQALRRPSNRPARQPPAKTSPWVAARM